MLLHPKRNTSSALSRRLNKTSNVTAHGTRRRNAERAVSTTIELTQLAMVSLICVSLETSGLNKCESEKSGLK